MERTIFVTECFARDGLQSIERVLSTQEKLSFLKKIADCGFKRIEVTSLVPPQYLPQFYDAEPLLSSFFPYTRALKIVFVPNRKGALRLLPYLPEWGSEIAFLTVVSATETHNRINLKRSQQETMEEQKGIAEIAHKYGVRLIGSISVSFGCPYEGDIPLDSLLPLIDHYREISVDEIQLGDTTGMANPKKVRETLSYLLPYGYPIPFIAHFHDTRGAAIANTLTAVEMGVSIVDSSLGGLGGRPPSQKIQISGPTGNTSSEDLVLLLSEMGYETGIDLPALLKLGKEVADFFDTPLYSHSVYGGLIPHRGLGNPVGTGLEHPSKTS